MNEITFVNSEYDTLDRIADVAEEILWRVGLPGQVRGGHIYPNALQMKIKWNCDPLQMDKCNELNAAIKRTFGCYGGVDIQTLNLFLTAEKTAYSGREGETMERKQVSFSQKQNIVTIDDQEAMGLRRPRREMVQPAPQQQTIVRWIPTEINQTSHTIDVQPSAQHIVNMKTSAVDRAQGFLIANVPLFAGLALGFVLVSVFFFNVPFLSLPALVIFWLSFVAAWLVSYIYTLMVSAEGIALYEAKKKWQIIEREQRERWDYYKNQGK